MGSFRVFGFPVHIHPSFLLVALFGLSGGSVTFAAIWVVIVLLSTLIHELGHAFAFRAFGRPSSITLWAFGGYTQGDGHRLDAKKDVVVSLAGPLVGIVLVGLPAVLVRVSSGRSEILDLIIFVSIGWSVLNLLPILPLDGGRVSASLMEHAWGARGARAARWLSIVVAAATGIVAAASGYVFGAAYALFFIAQNFTDLSALRDEPLHERIREGHDLIDAGDRGGAQRVAAEIESATRRPALRIAAIELAAWALLAQGRRADTAQALLRLPSEVRPRKPLLAAILLVDGEREAAVATAVEAVLGEAPPNNQLAVALEREGLIDQVIAALVRRDGDDGVRAAAALSSQLHFAGRYAASIAIGTMLFEQGRGARGVHAYNVACGLARSGDAHGALSWLERAVEHGFAERALLDGDEDLASVRALPGYAPVRARAG